MTRLLVLLVVVATVVYAAYPHSRLGDFGVGPVNCTGGCQHGDHESIMNRVMKLKEEEWSICIAHHECPKPNLQNLAAVPCTNGRAGEYPCSRVDLLSFINFASLGAGASARGNDIWGWTDPLDGKEYAIAGCSTGTSFIDITDPVNPSVLGFLPTHTVSSSWRDIKVYKNFAFIVSEATNHGMQIFDLTLLRSLPRNPVGRAPPVLSETAFYAEFGSAHNIVINEESGYAYSVGSRTCNAGLHMVDIRDPLRPQFAGCFGDDGYVHDAQCVNYRGPDTKYTGKEICFCYDEDSLTIVDVTEKQNPIQISRTLYNSQYTHQGWALPGFGYLLLDDELDEIYGSNKHTRTLLWDIHDLEKPVFTYSFYSSQTAVDHNLYTLGDLAYQANYCAGLRVLNTANAPEGGPLVEVAYFDVAPDCSTTSFLGSWSTYPYYPSGTVVVQSIDRGFFALRHNK